MTGHEYEQFVRAVLVERLKLTPDRLKSTRSPGATLPSEPGLRHQVDLLYVHGDELAEYITIIECKYRSSGLVDQPDLQNLAFVRDSMKAHKAMMVTNNGFTTGATALADSHKIALLVVSPNLEIRCDSLSEDSASGDTDEVFRLIQSSLNENPQAYDITVVRRFAPDPTQQGGDIVAQLLSDPGVREAASRALKDPGLRSAAERALRENPDLARAARDFFGGKRW